MWKLKVSLREKNVKLLTLQHKVLHKQIMSEINVYKLSFKD